MGRRKPEAERGVEEAPLLVFAVRAYGTYGGGLAVVAASAPQDAVRVASTIVDEIWRTRYHEPYEVRRLDCVAVGTPRVLTHFETGE